MLSDADAGAVLGCVQDKSGQYLVREREFVLQVTKDDAIIQRKNWRRVRKAAEKDEVKKALDEYYQEVDALVQGKTK